MTHVSKHSLDQKFEQKLFLQFSNLFVDCNQKVASALLDEILTDSEKIMLLKRVAIVLMLTEDFSCYKISKTLKVSESTVKLTKNRYKNKEFSALLRTTEQSGFDKEKFWQTLDVLLRLGMPPMGRGRWSFLDKS